MNLLLQVHKSNTKYAAGLVTELKFNIEPKHTFKVSCIKNKEHQTKCFILNMFVGI